MLFASSFGEGIFVTMIFVGLGMWGLRRVFKQFDKDGKVHDTAQKGVVGVIERWFKK